MCYSEAEALLRLSRHRRMLNYLGLVLDGPPAAMAYESGNSREDLPACD